MGHTIQSVQTVAMIRLRLFKTQRHRHIFVGKHRTLEQTFTQNSFDGASECIPNNSEVAGFCQRPRYYSNFLLRKCKKQHLPTKFAVHDHREYKDNAKFAAQVERKFFHLTARQDVWPIILGAGVVYIGARFLQNYYAAKESGELHKSSKKATTDSEPEDKNSTTDEIWGDTAEFGKITGIMGLDAGSLYSRVSVLSTDTGKVQVVENAEGQRATPSCVGVQPSTDTEEDEWSFLVGTQAETLPHIYAPNVLIGRRYDDEKANAFIKDLQYEDYVKKGIGGTMQVIIGDSGVPSSPELLTSKLISHMRSVASSHLDTGNCSHAYLALPAEAAVSPRVRSAMQIAAEQSNLCLLGASQEPLCGLLGAISSLGGMEKISTGISPPSLVIVCDVGRSTDVSILRIVGADAEHKIEGVGTIPYSQNHVETVHMASDPFAGGSLFDQALVDYIVSDFERQHKIDLRVDPMTAKRVKDAARAARIELSSKLQSEINEPFITADATGPKHLLYDLSRSKLEKLCANSVEKVLNVCKSAMESCENEISDSELQNANLVVLGGMARMPYLVDRLRQGFVEYGCSNLNSIKVEQPEEMNAYGAGLKAAIKLNEIIESEE